MKCAKCKCEVSISDRTCPKCGNDLLQFGATAFYEPKDKDKQRYGQKVKDMVFGGLHAEAKEPVKAFDAEETRIFMPIFEKRFLGLISRHLSDEELDELFDEEIVPTIHDLSKDLRLEKTFEEIEKDIIKNLGNTFNIYNSANLEATYKRKGKIKKVKSTDILAILRAGEIFFSVVGTIKKEMDLSAKMFPFFKASEVACRLYSMKRYKNFINNEEFKSKIEELSNLIDGNIRNIKDIPWIIRHKGPFKNFFSLIRGLLKDIPNDDLNNCRNTGFSLYFLGGGLVDFGSHQFAFNMFNTKGSNTDKSELAGKLCDLQESRNERMHGKIEQDEQEAQNCRNNAYCCLREIPRILEP